MANAVYQEKQKRNKRIIFGTLKWCFRLFIAGLIVLFIYILSELFGWAFSDYVDSFLLTIDKAIYFIATKWNIFLQETVIGNYVAIGIAYLKYYAPTIIGLIVISTILFRLIFKGMWRLFLRPWFLLTAGFGCFILYALFLNTNLINFGPISFIVHMFFDTILLLNYGIQMVNGNIANHILSFLRTNYIGISAIWSYLIILIIFGRITTWWSITVRYEEMPDSTILDICNEVWKEARKKTFRTPRHVVFYYSPDNNINAFAFGYNKICLTKGLIDTGNVELIKGVISHELGHIVNYDCVSNTLASCTVNLCFWFLFLATSFCFGAASTNENEKTDTGTAVFKLLFMVFGLIGLGIQKLLSGVHYMCYLLGGKLCEYKADYFGTSIGYGLPLLYFFHALDDGTSGGLKDPHPTMKNRIDKVLISMKKLKNTYSESDIKAAQQIVAI